MLTQETTPTMPSPAATRERLRNYTRDVGLLPGSTILQMRALVKILEDIPDLGLEWAMHLDLSLVDALDAVETIMIDDNERIL